MDVRRQAPATRARGAASALPAPACRGLMTSKSSARTVRQSGAALTVALAIVMAATGFIAASRAAGDAGTGPKSGLPVPRFVSLKPDRVNVRGGPTRDHDVTFVYTRAGLPVEITPSPTIGVASATG